MSETLRPAAGWELASMIAPYIERREPMEIVGSGSKRAIGRPMQTATTISTASMRGTHDEFGWLVHIDATHGRRRD